MKYSNSDRFCTQMQCRNATLEYDVMMLIDSRHVAKIMTALFHVQL